MTALPPRMFDDYTPLRCIPSRETVEWWRVYIHNHPGAKATVDFECRSACSLLKHGAYLYSVHHSTQAMCMSYRLPGQAVHRWHMAHPQHLIAESMPPLELFAFIEAGGLLEAHNAFFETVIWENVLAPVHGWPLVPRTQWRCSAAKACACSIPRDLEGACVAMQLDIRKDMEGNRIMKKMCKPRKPRKDEIVAWMESVGLRGDYRRFTDKFTEANGYLWHEEEEDIYKLWAYCDTDVEAEEALSDALPDLSPEELRVWQADQASNLRGVKFDLDMARAALKMAADYKDVLNVELQHLTSDQTLTASRRAAVKEWLLEHENLDLPDTAADTLEFYLKYKTDLLTERSKRVMAIMREANRTSTRKYQAMLDKCDPHDWRARDLLMYHGAGTGRWTGKGIQVQNFPGRDLMVKDFVAAAADVRAGNLAWVIAFHGDPMKFLSHSLRGAIMPEGGKVLAVADYSAIEARCVLWEAEALAALQVFRQGGDIYCDMATGIYGYPVRKKTHPVERAFGKQAILGLGYEMGYITFLLTCRKYDIRFTREECVRIMGEKHLADMENWVRRALCMDPPPKAMTAEQAKRYKARKRQAARIIRRLVDAREDPRNIVHELALMKHTVDVYRSRYPEVKTLWRAQEKAAVEAVRGWEKAVRIAREEAELFGDTWNTRTRDAIVGPSVECSPVRWQVIKGFLHCFLPSGRPIRYRDPEIKEMATPWGEVKPALRYMSVDGVTKKWVRTATYGGKLVENMTQAIARDIMAAAFVSAEEGGIYFPLMTVHDELVCEVDADVADADEFEALMTSPLPWADGCPIGAEAEIKLRYGK